MTDLENNKKDVLVDIKNKGVNYESVRVQRGIVDLRGLAKISQSHFFNKILFVVLGFLGVFISLYILAFIFLPNIQNNLESKSGIILENFSQVFISLESLDSERADVILEKNEKEIALVQGNLIDNRNKHWLGLLADVLPLFNEAKGVIFKIKDINDSLKEIAKNTTDLKQNFLNYIQFDGATFVTRVETIQKNLNVVQENNESIKKLLNKLNVLTPFFSKSSQSINENYLGLSLNIYRVSDFLKNLLVVLKNPEKSHYLIFFENPSEIRPGGGFIGSYADVVLVSGQIAGMEIKDVAEADSELNLKVIPPLPVQTIAQNWGAKDANWFFDFPASSAKVIQFLENSDLYKSKNIKFEGALAINTYAVQSILEEIGPIVIDNPKVVFNGENFALELRRTIEMARKKKADDPKSIIKILQPLILSKINNLSDEKKSILLTKLFNHLEQKDIKIYSKNQGLANFLALTNIDGGIYRSRDKILENYLAVVNANLGGGKSDAYVKESINLKINLDTAGTALNELVVTRENYSNQTKELWYRKDNNNFIQIFTPQGSNFVSMSGNSTNPKSNTYEYVSGGYEKDTDVENLEKTATFIPDMKLWKMDYAQKSLFGTWFNVGVGKTKELNLRYDIPSVRGVDLGDGSKYRMVFENQSGMRPELSIKINAPLGFKWQESDAALFSYSDKNPKGRVIIDLTLKKINRDANQAN